MEDKPGVGVCVCVCEGGRGVGDKMEGEEQGVTSPEGSEVRWAVLN